MGVTGRLACMAFLLSIFGCVGACTGLIAGLSGWLSPPREERAKPYPYPHHIPKQPDGVSLRFAMVHDVLHERFPRHGEAYYKARNQRVRRALAEMEPQEAGKQRPSAEYFALLDDLAVDLEFVGEHDEAIRVMRDKLKRQEALGMKGRELYSTYANLGTFLILGPFRQVRPGNEDDKQVLREGLALIQSSIKVNPDAHFGREIWQAILIEYMIALLDKPDLLLRYDMIGNALESDVDPSERRCLIDPDQYLADGANRSAADIVEKGSSNWAKPEDVRKNITSVGAEGNSKNVIPSLTGAVPFDEPTLGIIGMWRLGGGAHPYFALALGETMLRVGQRYIAWSAFERAARLAPLAWPDQHMQQAFEEHCRRRQTLLEDQLQPEAVAKLRPGFDAELQHGQAYQRAYQRYEEEQISAGQSPNDSDFYQAFHAERGPIATPVGPEDQFMSYHSGSYPVISYPPILLCAGLATLFGSLSLALVLRWMRPQAKGAA